MGKLLGVKGGYGLRYKYIKIPCLGLPDIRRLIFFSASLEKRLSDNQVFTEWVGLKKLTCN